MYVMNRILTIILYLLTVVSMEASTILVEWRGNEGVGKTKTFSGNKGDVLEFRCSASLPYSGDFVKLYLTEDGVRREIVGYNHLSNISANSNKKIYFQLPESKEYSISYNCNISKSSYLSDLKIRIDLISTEGTDYNVALKNWEEFHLDGFHYRYNSVGLVVCQCSAYQYNGDITVPSTVIYRGGEYAVKEIEKSAFYQCKDITSIIVGDSVSSIGSSTFYGCSSLKTITLGNGITTISDYAFYGCSSLENLTIPANLVTIGNNTFQNCDKLSKIELPDKVVSIGEKAFTGCDNLESVTIGRGVTNIGGYLFDGCTNLQSVTWNAESCASSYYLFNNVKEQIKEFTIGNDVIDIPMYLCSGMSNIQSLNIPNNVNSIDQEAFMNCVNLSTVKIGNGVKTIGSNAFSGCSNMTSLSIGDSVTTINISAFEGCCSLDTLIIPNSVTTIKGNAFLGCEGLSTVIIGSNVNNIKEYAFKNCTNLSSVISYASIPPVVSKYSVFSVYGNLYVPKGTAIAYATADVWKNFNIIEMIDVEKISIEQETCYVDVGETKLLNVMIEPDNANKNIYWSSNNSDVVEVDQSGNIIGKKIGETEVTVETTDGTNLTSKCKVYVRIPISKILLGDHSLTLYRGRNKSLSASISPVSATYKTIRWTSSNPNIATVDENGTVTAVSNGTAYIHAVSTDGTNQSDSCSITVKTLAESISMNKNNIDLIVGKQISLSTNILPTETSDKRVTWTSSNENVAVVTNNGVISAISTGTAIVTAMTTDGSNLLATCTVKVTNPVASVSLNEQEVSLYLGKNMTLVARCLPENSDDTTIMWTSNDETIASVTNGIITAKSLGTTTISATSVTGVTSSCIVHVIPILATDIILDKTNLTMNVEEFFLLTAAVKPDDTTDKSIEWVSNNENVVAVSQNGMVTAKKSGTAIITAKALDGSSVMANCTIVVKSPVKTISFDKNEIGMLVGERIQLAANCYPQDADNTNVTWTSGDTDIVNISNDGEIIAVGAGNTTITATTMDGTNLSATCIVSVNRHSQSITWDETPPVLYHGGELVEIAPIASSGLPLTYKSNDENVFSVFNLGDVVYLNPNNTGRATLTISQEGNYYYEPATSVSQIVEVVKSDIISQSRTLVVYYSQDYTIDGIVATLVNQMSAYSNVSAKKVETGNETIDIDSYNHVILVYPLQNGMMISPMQTFVSRYSALWGRKNISMIEYSSDEYLSEVNAKSTKLTICASEIENSTELINQWLEGLHTTGIINVNSSNSSEQKIYDLYGRRLSSTPKRGVYIENRIKKAK